MFYFASKSQDTEFPLSLISISHSSSWNTFSDPIKTRFRRMDTRTFLNFSVPISHSTNPWFVGGAYYYYDYVMRIVAKCLHIVQH